MHAAHADRALVESQFTEAAWRGGTWRAIGFGVAWSTERRL